MNLMFNITFMLSVCEKFSIMMMVEDQMNFDLPWLIKFSAEYGGGGAIKATRLWR